MALRSLLQSAGPRGSSAVHGCSRMATFDEVFPAAVQALEDRGLLLNMHLVGLVGGDEELLRTVREALIRDGLAHDRYGVGLAKSSNFDTQRATYHLRYSPEAVNIHSTEEIVFAGAAQSDTEWWIMSGGATVGPFSMDTLIQMRRLGKVSDIDMIREGPKGMWLIPKDVAELADISPGKRTSSKAKTPSAPTPPEIAHPATSAIFLRPAAPEQQRLAGHDGDSRRLRIPAATPSRPDVESTIEYFLWDAGNSVGPMSIQDLQTRLDSCSLDVDDFVQVGKDGDWQPLSLAMGVPRPPLQIPQSALIALQGEQIETALAVPHTTPLVPSRTPTPQTAIPVVKPGTTKSSKTAAKQSDELSESPLIRGWVKAVNLVGGQSRLWAIIATTSCAIAIVVWLQQPPPASVIYQELAATHKRISEGHRYQPGSSKAFRISTDEIQQIMAIREGLAKRASATQPAIQELLWACEYGLIPLMEQQYGSPDLERVFLNHMSRAEGLLDPSKVNLEHPTESPKSTAQ